MIEKLGVGGMIQTPEGTYDVLIMENEVVVVTETDGAEPRVYEVAGIGAFAAKAKNLRVGWASFGDGEMSCLYIYDKGDDCYGYAINLTDDWLSEWGYAPFYAEEGA